MKYFLSTLLLPFYLLASPANPSHILLRASAHTVSISWQDEADDEKGFKVYRNGDLLTTLAKNSTRYLDTDLSPNTTYTYTIKATDNNERTIEVHPGESINTAIKRAKPATTIYIHGAIYDEVIDLSNLSGTKDDWITLSNYHDEKPIISPSQGFTLDGVVKGKHISYVHINGLTIKNPQGPGIVVNHNSHDVIISNNEVYGLGVVKNDTIDGHAILVSAYVDLPSYNILITGNYVHDNFTRLSRNNNYTDDEAFTVRGDVHYVTIENNRVDNNQFIGIDLIGNLDKGREKKQWGYATHIIVRNNTLSGNCKNHEEWYGDGIYMDGGMDYLIENNHITNNLSGGLNTNQESESSALDNLLIRYNTIGNQRGNQISIGDTSSSVSEEFHDVFFHTNYIYYTIDDDQSASDTPNHQAHILYGRGKNIHIDNNYFRLDKGRAFRLQHDHSTMPTPQDSYLTNNIFSTQYALRQSTQKDADDQRINWLKESNNVSERNPSGIIAQCTTDFSRIPNAAMHNILGDRAIVYTHYKELGYQAHTNLSQKLKQAMKQRTKGTVDFQDLSKPVLKQVPNIH